MSIRIIEIKNKNKLADAIYLLRFDTQYEMAATFLRVQEHYESVRFSDRVFSLEQYIDWYVQVRVPHSHPGVSRCRCSAFTYYEDWVGFNVPSTALQPFYDGKFDPLLEKEKRLLQLLSTLRGRFYVIGIYKRQDLSHELAHALFSTDAAYSSAVLKALSGYDISVLKKRLAKDHAKHVILDEVHAGVLDEAESRALKPLRKELRALFKRHSAGLAVPKIRGAR
jgi:hypothetical protein